MLREQLVKLRNEYITNDTVASRLSHFFKSQDHAAKIAAINKLILDIDMVDVQYSSRDLTLLSRGKLGVLLQTHQHKLPARYAFEVASGPVHFANLLI